MPNDYFLSEKAVTSIAGTDVCLYPDSTNKGSLRNKNNINA